eukprot:14764533-Alexandrium_andersonii.AAC.1
MLSFGALCAVLRAACDGNDDDPVHSPSWGPNCLLFPGFRPLGALLNVATGLSTQSCAECTPRELR